MIKGIFNKFLNVIAICIISLILLEISLQIASPIVYYLNITTLNPQQFKGKHYTILTLGDSITVGHGSAPFYSYPRQLEHILEIFNPEMEFKVINRGIYGLNSSNLLRSLANDIKTYHPNLIVVMTGANNRWNYEDSNLPLILNEKVEKKFFSEIGIFRLLKKLKIYKLLKIGVVNATYKFHSGEVRLGHRKKSSLWLDDNYLSKMLFMTLQIS